jgi:prefoldin subunit 5
MDEKEEVAVRHVTTRIVEKYQALILGSLLTISIGLSAYVFKSIDTRLAVLETVVDMRGERIAVLEQQAKENTDAHRRIEAKLDIMIAGMMKK